MNVRMTFDLDYIHTHFIDERSVLSDFKSPVAIHHYRFLGVIDFQGDSQEDALLWNYFFLALLYSPLV